MAAVNDILIKNARDVMPGGVNSPVRSFKKVGGRPVFINKSHGAWIFSEDRRRFIDYCMSWGALILGHANDTVIGEVKKAVERGTSFGACTRKEIEFAILIKDALPSIEKIRLTNSGTEAVMGAVRLARAYTGRPLVIRFKGSYHGHADYFLRCRGVPEGILRTTLALPYNDIDAVRAAVCRHRNRVAAIIVEPVAGNCGVILPRHGFLKALREVCDREGIVLIFDEVITGFRVAFGGAQTRFGIRPDLTCLGKIIGGGFPVGAFGGTSKIMDLLSPEGDVFQAGTLSGNPVAVTAGIVTLKMLKKAQPYARLEETTSRLCNAIQEASRRYRVRCSVNHIASIFSIFFGRGNIQNNRIFSVFFNLMLERGIYLSPSGTEANFLSTAHKRAELSRTIDAVDDAFKKMSENNP